jgi:hypothetical protein
MAGLPGAFSPRVKRPGPEADHTLPSSAEVKERVELYLHSPNTRSWRGAQLRKAQIQIYLTFLPFHHHQYCYQSGSNPVNDCRHFSVLQLSHSPTPPNPMSVNVKLTGRSKAENITNETKWWGGIQINASENITYLFTY